MDLLINYATMLHYRNYCWFIEFRFKGTCLVLYNWLEGTQLLSTLHFLFLSWMFLGTKKIWKDTGMCFFLLFKLKFWEIRLIRLCPITVNSSRMKESFVSQNFGEENIENYTIWYKWNLFKLQGVGLSMENIIYFSLQN